MRKSLIGLSIAGLALTTTACLPTPCADLSAPSPQDIEAAGNGYEVEREDSMGNTCELSRDGSTWNVDD